MSGSRRGPTQTDILIEIAGAAGLFTDQDEMLFDAARPVILNGIENIVRRYHRASRSPAFAIAPTTTRS